MKRRPIGKVVLTKAEAEVVMRLLARAKPPVINQGETDMTINVITDQVPSRSVDVERKFFVTPMVGQAEDGTYALVPDRWMGVIVTGSYDIVALDALSAGGALAHIKTELIEGTSGKLGHP